ncbi:hypothetical protein AB4Z50_14570 [Paenibacillus sp. 2TAB26]|uniref:hypothetical protein n=1 Tax=Paenibacillus sp. 2TAB26 TaxID=3233005 RepID=UPI003F944298
MSLLESFNTLSDHVLSEMLCRWVKEERKGKKKADIQELGLDKYTNEDCESLIEEALNRQFIIVTDITEHGRKLQLTHEGRLTLAIHLTNNFSADYKKYEDAFNAILNSENQLPLPKISIMKFFHSGQDMNIVTEHFTQSTTSKKVSVAYHEHLLQEATGSGINSLGDEQYVFHLAPRLFVPLDLIGKKVTLEILGLEEPVKLAVSSPYRNKRYYIAGMKKGRMNTASGFYPIVGEKSVFPVYKEITLQWTIDEEIRVDHRLEIDFRFTTPIGRLFSTEQRFTREIALMDNFTVVTSINRESYSERNAKFIVQDIYNHFEIHENISLTNFPMELHHFSHAGSYFDRWYKEWSTNYSKGESELENKLRMSGKK